MICLLKYAEYLNPSRVHLCCLVTCACLSATWQFLMSTRYYVGKPRGPNAVTFLVERRSFILSGGVWTDHLGLAKASLLLVPWHHCPCPKCLGLPGPRSPAGVSPRDSGHLCCAASSYPPGVLASRREPCVQPRMRQGPWVSPPHPMFPFLWGLGRARGGLASLGCGLVGT